MLIIDLSMYSFISFIIMYLNLLNNKDVFVDIIKFIIMNDDDHMDLQVIVVIEYFVDFKLVVVDLYKCYPLFI